MKLLRAYSDLHGFLPHVAPCDGLLIAGDICPAFGEHGGFDPNVQARWIAEVFNPWCDAMPVEHIALIAGNHDTFLEPCNNKIHCEFSSKVMYMFDESALFIDGPLIYGSPWIPNLRGFSFYKSGKELKSLAKEVPKKSRYLDVSQSACVS